MCPTDLRFGDGVSSPKDHPPALTQAMLRYVEVLALFFWCFYGVSMVFLWCFNGVYMVFLWCFYGVYGRYIELTFIGTSLW